MSRLTAERLAEIRLLLTDRSYRDRLQIAADSWTNTARFLSEIDVLTAERDAERSRADALAAEVERLKRACLTPSGLACRLCTATWLEGEEDHHPRCVLTGQQQRGAGRRSGDDSSDPGRSPGC